jgi:hypothetical protein
MSPAGKDGSGTGPALQSFGLWLGGAKHDLGLRDEEIHEYLQNDHNIEEDLRITANDPKNLLTSRGARAIHGINRHTKVPNPVVEEDVESRDMGTLFAAASSDDDEQQGGDNGDIRGTKERMDSCAMLGALVGGPPSYSRWLHVKGKRQAQQMRNKYQIDTSKLEGLEKPEPVMDSFATDIHRAPKKLVVLSPADVNLVAAAKCFTGIVCGLTHVQDRVLCGKAGHKKKPCGADLRVNEVVFVNGRDCTLVNHHIYYLGVNRVEMGEVKACRVGVLKCLFNQVQYFANRMAQVTLVYGKGRGEKGDAWVGLVGGAAEISFLDRGLAHHRQRDAIR